MIVEHICMRLPPPYSKIDKVHVTMGGSAQSNSDSRRVSPALK
jgi:hypothetical protein